MKANAIIKKNDKWENVIRLGDVDANEQKEN